MSSEQLQSIFHVDSHELVPHYEVIRLTHHGTSHHSIAKRSINHQTSQQHLQNLSPTNQIVGGSIGGSDGKQQLHHVKKDLSKSAYYSELKHESNQLQQQQQQQPQQQQLLSTSVNKLNTNKSQIKNVNFSASSGAAVDDANDNNEDGNVDDDDDDDATTTYAQTVTEGMLNVHKFDENLDDVIETDEIKDSTMQHTTVDLSNINEHNVSLSAFGEVYNLTLRPTEGLFKNGTQSLRMWSVATNTNATQGLEYDQIEDEVSLFFNILHQVGFLHLFFFRCTPFNIRQHFSIITYAETPRRHKIFIDCFLT